MSKNQIISILFACVILVGLACGQTAVPPASPDSALLNVLASLPGEPLRLNDLLSIATTRSVGARDAAAALAAARGSLMKERGAFDPELFADQTRSSEKQPSASPFSGAAVLHPRTSDGAFGARLTLPIGTELQASVTTRKLETNSAFASLNPQYDASGSLSVRQPLLHGFGPAAWGDYANSKGAYAAAAHRYADAIAGLRASAESLYWDLYAAERDLAVVQLTRDQALSVLNEAELRAKAGLVGPNQANNARVFLAEQQLAYLDAEDNLTRISDELGSLLERRPPGETQRFRTLDEPSAAPLTESLETLLARALQNNHALQSAEAEIRAARALQRAARWNALPKADLVGALGGNGLSGTGQDVIFGSDTLRNHLDTQFSDALDQALNRDYPTWSVGIRLSMPILRRAERGERSRLAGEVSRAEQRYADLRHRLDERVRAVYRELVTGRDRTSAAEAGVAAARDQVRIGLIEFKNGTTTAFELVRLGADFANSQRRYSQALVRTAKAAAHLEQLAPANSEPLSLDRE